MRQRLESPSQLEDHKGPVRAAENIWPIQPSTIKVTYAQVVPPVFSTVKKESRMAQKSITKRVSRDSGTGQFVPKKYADTHPKTTETENVKVPVKPKPCKK